MLRIPSYGLLYQFLLRWQNESKPSRRSSPLLRSSPAAERRFAVLLRKRSRAVVLNLQLRNDRRDRKRFQTKVLASVQTSLHELRAGGPQVGENG